MIPGHNVRNTMQPTAEELLPEKARTKLEALRERRETSHAALMRASARMRELHDELTRNRHILAEYEDAVAHHGKVVVERTSDPNRIPWTQRHRTAQALVYARQHPPSDAQLEAQRRKVAELEKRHQRAKAEYDRLEQEWGGIARTETQLTRYLDRIVGLAEIAEASPVELKPRKNERPSDALGRVRAEIDALQREVQAVQRAPIPTDEAKAKARAQFERLRERGRPDCFLTIEHGEPIRWPIAPADFRLTAGGSMVGGGITVTDAPALLAWMLGDKMLKALEAEIDAAGDDANAIASSERPARIAELRRRILELERIEEHIVEMAEASGDYSLPRRETADPRAVLGLADELPAPEQGL